MNVLIIDDEELACARLQRLLENLHVKSFKAYQNPLQALLDFQKGLFDVVLVDISMPQLGGLELAKKLIEIDENIFIIFQTAHEEYALEAFRSGGVDYLLKPIDEKYLQSALEKVQRYKKQTQSIEEKKLFGKNGDTFYMVDPKDAYYIKADLDEVIVKTKDSQFYMRKKIGSLSLELENLGFFRIHRSILINTEKIKSLKSVEQSKLLISFYDISDKITSSKEGAKEFRDFLEKKSF